MNLETIKKYLKEYEGEEVALMEVCGSHTGAISKFGIPTLLSKKIRLISGPGCPVCVTPSAYIDRLIELCKEPDTCVATFGDLMRVPGSEKNLSLAKGEGGNVRMVYSPMELLTLAKENPTTNYIFAAVGFETTTPVYALLLESLIRENIKNVKLLTALKTMPAAINWLCASGAPITGFIAPGHVSVITGSDIFKPLADKYGIPFAVAGFQGEEILEALYGLVKCQGSGKVMNFYPKVVTAEGNTVAQKKVATYFEESSAVWRGMGAIEGSGLLLRKEYAEFDAGSADLNEDKKINKACRCDQVLMGKISPTECPLFRKVCNPMNPQGACMVSEEGSCHQYLVNNRR